MKYRTTHYSTTDGSPAMLIGGTDETVLMMNESGDMWEDPVGAWSTDPSWQWNAPHAND